MDDFDNDDELIVIADALGMFGPKHPHDTGSTNAPSSPPFVRVVPRGKKTPCEGSTPKKAVAVVKDAHLEDRVNKLGEVTLDGFEKLSRRITNLEQARNPSSFSMSSLNKGCLIAIVGYAGILVIMAVFAVVFHLLGMTPR